LILEKSSPINLMPGNILFIYIYTGSRQVARLIELAGRFARLTGMYGREKK